MAKTTCKALLSFMKLSENNLLGFGSFIISCMTGNINFPGSDTLLANLVKAQEAYAAALTAAMDGGRVNIAVKNTCKANLLEALRRLSTMVNYLAHGSREILTTSGYDLSSDTAVQDVTVPGSLMAKYTDTSGQMEVAVKGVKGHKGMVYQYAVADDSNLVGADASWVSEPCSSASYTFKNLPVGKKVMIRVGISGPRRQVVYTEPLTKVVA